MANQDVVTVAMAAITEFSCFLVTVVARTTNYGGIQQRVQYESYRC